MKQLSRLCFPWLMVVHCLGCGGGENDPDALVDAETDGDADGDADADWGPDADESDSAPDGSLDGGDDDVDIDGDNDGDDDGDTDMDGEHDADFDDDSPLLPVEVETELGRMRGEDQGDLVVFKGIPYASPPLEELRFRTPRPHPGWTETRDATTFGHICPQSGLLGYEGNEDCLTLNIWAPVAPGPRPVMVFIHGGGFQRGAGSKPQYEGSVLARAGDVVVVTLNYRLGPFGFLTTEALETESDDGSVGNYGIRDQIAALEWIRRNIAAFGGDGDNVTIFGESAGGLAVCVLLGSPMADGLYHRAIIESGAGCYGFLEPDVETETRPSMLDRGAELVVQAECDDAPDEMECMRTVDAELIVEYNAPVLGRSFPASLQYCPTLDGVVLAEDPLDRIARGDAPIVPIISGSNADESSIFTIGTPILTWRAFEDAVRELLGDDDEAVLRIYPPSAFDRPKQALNALVSDLAFICPSLVFAEETSISPNDVYFYHFTHIPEGLLGAAGAMHGLEVFFIFGTFPEALEMRPESLAVAETMQAAWSSFAHSGVPLTDPAWPSYSPGPAIALIDEDVVVTGEIREGRCEELQRAGLVR